MRRALQVGSVLWLASCVPNPRCDPGQRFELGSCLPEVVKTKDAGNNQDSGDSTLVDAQVADAGAACKPGPGNYEGFGKSCKSDLDCTACVAPTCATAPINVCSRIQCQDDPEACPPGWSCTDISAFSMNPKVTHICLKL